MIGRRVHADEKGFLPTFEEGDYGFDPIGGNWYGRPFGGDLGNLANHDVTEHEDGTITVSPSILIEGETKWHGYLSHGEWHEAT